MALVGNTKASKRNAFTLLELLVVVAIIAVLLAFLIPVIADAKRRAKIIKCQSNLRQIGLAIHQYVNEHDGYFPATHYTDQGVYGGKPGLKYFKEPPAEKRKLWQYLDNVEVYHCPADIIERPLFTVGGTVYGPCPYYDWVGTSYKLNCSDIPEWALENTLIHKRFTDVVDPNRTIMVTEPGGWPHPPDGDVIVHKWHHPSKPLSNILFVDGHVRLMVVGESGKDTDDFKWSIK